MSQRNLSQLRVTIDSDDERLKIAQWILERNLAWIAAAEVKVGVVVAIDTAMLGGIGTAFSASDLAAHTAWAFVLTVGATAALICGIFCAAMAVLPRVNGPAKSLVFFGRVGPMDEPEYVEQFKNATIEQLLEDWTTQVHRNAQIACQKFRWVRASMYWSFAAVLPWFAAIILLFKK